MAHTDFMRCKSPRVLDRTQSKLSSIVHCKSVGCLQSCFLKNRFLAAVEVNTKEKNNSCHILVSRLDALVTVTLRQQGRASV